MTLRSAGLVTEPMTGPRALGVATPQRIGKRAAAVPGSGCEVSRIWVERLGVVMGCSQRRKQKRLPAARAGRALKTLRTVRRSSRSVNVGDGKRREAVI